MARLIRLALFSGVSLFALSGPAFADPGSLIVTSLLGLSAASGAGAIIAGAINIGLSFGLSLLASAFQSKPEQPKPQDVQGVVRQSIPPRWRHYGLRRVGGAMMFIETKNGDLWQVIAFASHRIEQFLEWIIDSRHVTVDSDGWVDSDPYGSDNVRVISRQGSTTQGAYTQLITAFPSVWTEAHQGKGIAHAMLLARSAPAEKFNQRYPNRIPVLNAIIQGARVDDPRSGANGYSANLALITRDFLSHDDGMQIDAAYLDDAEFVQAANDCDVLLPTKAGGTVRRYHGALSYSFDAEPKSVLERLIRACDGRLCLKPNGKIGFSVGVWRAPTITLTDEHIIDYQLADGGGPLREFNEIRFKYEEPLADFAAAEAEPWRREDEISAFGEVRSTTIEAYEIQHHNHARRVQKIIAAKAAPRWQGTLKTTLFGMQAWDQRWIRVHLPDMDSATEGPFDETMEVLDVSLDFETMTVSVQVASIGPEAYAFDPATEEGTAPAIPESLEEGAIPTVTLATAIGTQRTISGGTQVALIKFSVAKPDRDDLKLEVDYSIADAENWQPAGVAPNSISGEIVGLVDGALYDVRFRWRGTSGTVGNYVVIENIPAVADPNAPAVPTELSVVAGDQPNTAKINWRNPNAANFKSARIYRSTGTDAGAATLVGTSYGAPNGADSFTSATLGVGTHRFWVASANGSGVESARTPAGMITIV